MAHCDQFAWDFADKINWIRADLDSGFELQSLDTWCILTSCISWDGFLLLTSEDVDRIVDKVWPTTSSLDPCPS